MDKLLPHYEQELGILRRASQQFAERHPALAKELGLAADCSADPEVERLLQSVALLNATTSQRIASAHEQLTAALLRNTRPHAIRTLPSSAIAQIDLSGEKSRNITHASCIERGTEFRALTGNEDCRFRNAFDLVLLPLTIDTCRYSQSIDVPSSLQLPSHCAASIELGIRTTVAGTPLHKNCAAPLRLYIDAPPQLRAALFEALFTRAISICIESHGAWKLLDNLPFSLPVLHEDTSLLPPPLDPLAEYFAYPDKFAFLDVDLPALLQACPPHAEHLRVVIALPDKRNAAVGRALLELNAAQLKTGCAPLINLYPLAALPMRLTPERHEYQLEPAERSTRSSALYTIDSVRLTRKTGEASCELPCYDGTSHANSNLFWQLRTAGEENFIRLLDSDGLPASCDGGILCITFTATDGDAPQALKTGQPGGNLAARKGNAWPVRLLHRPTAPQVKWPEQQQQWQLLSPPRLRIDDTAEALREVLRLHGGTRQAALIDAIRTVLYMSTFSWHQEDGNSRYLHGMAVTVLIDEQRAPEHSMFVFATLLSHWFRYTTREGSFTQLTFLSATTGDVLVRCQPQAGTRPLI
ncbi:type VI secretion system baseplate subunit TssF [Pseudoduganella rhizocola]|uniref:type VI secretion system baseplate subunit TssF n=1 Tax=Pseudoduganella rhizocola TaxID=3382643 RepID=UPI0038B6231C